MKDDAKTRDQLVIELKKLRLQNAELEKTLALSKVADLLAQENIHYAESIVETVRGSLLILDANLKIISANDNFYTMFKVNPGETIGRFIYDLGNKQWDIPKLRELLEQILPKKEAFDSFEVEHTFRDIGHKIMLLNARQIYRKDIGSKIILLAIEDITEHKRIENILVESEYIFRRTYETASDAIFLLEKREGKIAHANPASERMFGYTEKEIIGNKLQEVGLIIDNGDFQITMKKLNNEEGGILRFDDVPVRTKSGQYIFTDIYLVDKAKFTQCNVRDITERKRLDNELLYKHMMLERTEKISHIGSWEWDIPRDKVTWSNELFRIFQRDPREGAPSFAEHPSLYHPDDMARLQQAVEASAARGTPYELELRAIRKDGETRICLSHGFAEMASGGGAVRLYGSFQDITDQKKAEEQLQNTLERLRKAVRATIQVMVSAVETRDPYTAGHQFRVADLARAIATDMELSQDKIDGIRVAASIHDIGKLSLPAEILSKPTKLSEVEFSLIKNHALQGYEILKGVESPWPMAEIVYQHHERMDGSGYPRNLQGNDILIEARILAVADVVEAMASHRPYRPALGIDEALKEIEKNRGTLYDEAVTDACLKLWREKGYQLEGT